jgi:hypothetical protein
VHPTHHIGIAFHHQTVAIIAEPCWNRHAHARPLVAGALCIAFGLNDTIVESKHPVFKFSFAKSGAGFDHIHYFSIHFYDGRDGVQIAISPTPEMQVF